MRHVSSPVLADVVRLLERRYPPSTAESWDAVGLVTGDPTQPVRRVLFAVDPVAAVVDEATAWGADLVVTHHPLLLRPVHSIAATTFKGALLHRLVRVRHRPVHRAHQRGRGGRGSQRRAGRGARPRRHGASGPRARQRPWTSTWCSSPSRTPNAWSTRSRPPGAGAIGEYTRCAWTSTGEGTFTPSDAASPTDRVGR